MLLVSVVHKSARVRYIGLCCGEMGSNARIKTASVQRITVCVQCVCFKILFGFFGIVDRHVLARGSQEKVVECVLTASVQRITVCAQCV